MRNLVFWPSLGFFSLIVLGAFYLYRQDSYGLIEVMTPLAARYGGTLKPATLMSFPQLRFEQKGRLYSVQAMPNAGSAALPGPFTFVQLVLPFDSACKADVKRKPALVRGALTAIALDWQATTGDSAFDNAFRFEGQDQKMLAERLNRELRARLIASALPGLHLRIAGKEIHVFVEGLVKTSSEIEEMIDLAGALADRCENETAQTPQIN